MPSIPQSLLWISLVVLWLFVLVPMLISKREAVRRTSDVALATRVLNGEAGARLLKRSRPAAGHRSDPDWQPDEEWERDEPVDGAYADADEDHENAEADTDAVPAARPVVMAMAKVDKATEADEPDYLDVDVIEDAGALPAGASARAAEPALLAVQDTEADGETDAEPVTEVEPELADDEYEYVEDDSGLEPGEDEDDEPVRYATGVNRRKRFDSKKAAAISARKYAYRKKVLLAMAVVLIGSAVTAFEVTPLAWWLCGAATTVTVLYLAYLRRQTRIEEKVRRRRMHRMARAQLGVENAHDHEYDVVPSRLRRPGAVVLEIDDEDPIFEHLDDAASMRNYGWSRDLARAVGQ
ncbi:hypothetical protein MKUB_44610 [Mycobacterium kubicae]|uniref:Transmembrane protein n=1 Tax=Mycobacterium kubicae TaxID=120959 RepID=A0AAX1J8V6_9MYCO|nr:gephyrin-like molybdotransferase receptor GlpR [Mycobacterium kubicae]MCV7097588.1 hypothetical protein [Mycobacterium kubicae]ORV96590.1 hypothetical protein AWC13_18170 [Mycobacterium kubicae]QNI13463.1 hypothetical protein GAN18_21925 [Mycobacterium kubicae]QPI36982.1 hypothetical protein I2456_21530 [Mycobacterium kubicae]GFG66971.1 hypothetical protein MKUB_44610 [Mycobacterium kubicae]